MDGERHTKVDGLEVTWRLARHEIEIVKVRNDSDGRVVTFEPGTDLADARDDHPKWNRLWDKVSTDFWAELIPPVRRSSDTRWSGEQPSPGW